MANIALARRYARALLEVATEENSVDVVGERLQELSAALAQSPELTGVLSSPSYDRGTRLGVLNAVLAQAGQVPASLGNTLKLLNDRNRLGALPELATAFRELSDERAGRVRGTVTSAVPLSPTLVSSITADLAKLSGKQVVVETQVDPSLLGGVAAQVGSTLYDGSLRTQLKAMKQQLTSR